MAFGDIYRLFVKFQGNPGGKERFAVEIDNVEFEVVILDTITSQFAGKSEYIQLQYYPIKNWREAGLKQPSYIDIKSPQEYSFLEMIQNSKYTGSLTIEDIRGLEEFVASYPVRLQNYKRQKK